METYKVVRNYFKGIPRGCRRVIKSGLTLEEAQAHCKDPETSSSTCKLARNKARTERFGSWFDGYTKE